MKTTRLVILFNLGKLVLGTMVALTLLVIAYFLTTPSYAVLLCILAGLIVANMIASLTASYLLYDQSDLFRLRRWPRDLVPADTRNALLVHASFDPISRKLEAIFPTMSLIVYNIFGNRHEKDRGVAVSNRVFPPHPDEAKIDPTGLPEADDSQDIIFGVTAIHELLTHERRVQFFKEAQRVLRQDGQLILIEQMRTPLNFLFFNIGAFHFLTPREWRRCISEADLVVTREKKMTPFGDLWIISKRPISQN
jgi:Methyltransferase domain